MITVFPNPTPDRAYINISWEPIPKTQVKDKTYTLHVFDVSGREAMPQQVMNFSYGMLQSLDVTALPKGVYMLQLNADTDVQRTNLVKE